MYLVPHLQYYYDFTCESREVIGNVLIYGTSWVMYAIYINTEKMRNILHYLPLCPVLGDRNGCLKFFTLGELLSHKKKCILLEKSVLKH